MALRLKGEGTEPKVREEFNMSVVSGVRQERQAWTGMEGMEGMESRGQVESLMPEKILERSDAVMEEKKETLWSLSTGGKGSGSSQMK